jgi:PAS domain S-box-containing protein
VAITSLSTFPFLKGGGELGELTRNLNWSTTSLGNPDQWPSSLRSGVSILLNSQFPMFIWWGEELTTIYNDSYKIIAGNKHPALLGKSGREGWSEIWDDLAPLVDRVFKGESTWSEDLRLEIERRGFIETAYFTFSYSPILLEAGEVGGLFCAVIETTEKVKNRKKIEASEEKLRNLILKSPAAICIVTGADFKVEIANDKMYEIWAKQQNEVLNRPLSEVIPLKEFPAFKSILDKVYFTGKTFNSYGTPITVNKNGKEESIYVNVAYEALREADGSIYGIIIISTEVTEQVLAGKKIEESEQRVRAIVDSAPFPIAAYIGKEMRIQMANQAIIDVWGKGPDVITKLYPDLLPELENQEIFEHLDRVYTSGIPFHARNKRLEFMVDGTLKPYYFNYSITPLLDSAGKVYGVMNTAADVTDLNLAKQRIEESEARFRSMVEQAPVAIALTRGTDLLIESINHPMKRFLVKDGRDPVGRRIIDVLPELSQQPVIEILQTVLDTAKPFIGSEVPIRLKVDGQLKTFYFNLAYTPMFEAGKVTGILHSALDVTEPVLARKKIEESEAELQKRVDMRTRELAIAIKELQRSNAQLEEFAHAASHDLKEPIRKINFYTDKLKNQLSLKLIPEDIRMFERVEHASLRMNTLIDDLLLYSHVSQRPHEKESIDLNEKIRNVIEDLELNILEKKAVIKIGDLPVVKGYKRQLQQLFHNLLTNAIKYSIPGVIPEIRITSSMVKGREVGLSPDRDYHLLTFVDNGIGFEQEHAEKIFQMFQRLHPKTEYEGTGVGLSIARKVAENHEGRITAQSEPGKGATFKLYLPAN